MNQYQSEQFVTNVTNRMIGLLSEEQLTALKQSLYIELYDYDIQEKETALVEVDSARSNEIMKLKYLAALKAEGKSEQTIAQYRLHISLLLDNTQKSISEISTDDMRYFLYKYQEKKHISNTTLDNMRRIYSTFFRFLCDEGWNHANPMKRIAKIRHSSIPEKIYSEAELEHLKNACNNKRDRAIIELLESSGIRVSECAQINRTDIDFEKRSIIIRGKGQKYRTAFFDEKTQLYLGEYLSMRKDNKPALFLSLNKKDRVSKHAIEQMVSRLGKKAGVKGAHPHRYRVTCLTKLINRGCPIVVVQEIAGHSDIRITRHYYRSNAERVRFEYLKAS